MDVTCDRCKAEYEFDEALLGERGTTVKCSACGHVFRVLPPSRDAVRSSLHLRYARDGSTRALSSLRELQQRIRAGEVSLDDQLGREGFPFRALRDVPELKNFFLAQPGRHEQSTVRPEGTYPRPDPGRMPVHPESISPGPEELSSDLLDSDRPDDDASTHPPPPRAEVEARRREAAERAAQAVAEQREANRTIPAPAGIPPEQRPRSFRQGTISGVGPNGQLPPPPRMPEFGPRPRQDPVPTTPAPTTASDNPHASKLPPPGTGTVTGLPLKPHQTLYGASMGLAGSAASNGMQPGSTHPLATRHSDRPLASATGMSNPRSPGGQGTLSNGQTALPRSESTRPPIEDGSLPKPLVEPDRFPQFKPVKSPLPPGPGKPAPRKLYLDENEKAPPRATQGSRAWLYVALLLLAAGGGGWFGLTRTVSGKAILGAARDEPLPVGEPGAPETASGEPGPSDTPAANAGPQGAAPEGASPGFVPPIPELQEELARRTEAPEEMKEPEANAKPKPDTAKPGPVAANAVKPAAPAPNKPVAPAPAEAKPAAPTTKPGTSVTPAATRPGAGLTAAAKPPPAPAKPPVEAAAPVAKNDKVARTERLAAANPQDYGAQLNYADALYGKGDTAAAIAAYQKALSVRPSGSEANSGMGFALLKDGKASDALPYFDRAANSGYAEANIGLGDAYRALGQPSSAKEAYQAYLDRLATGARAEYARTWLDKLSGGGAAKAERSAEPETYRPAGELSQPPQ